MRLSAFFLLCTWLFECRSARRGPDLCASQHTSSSRSRRESITTKHQAPIQSQHSYAGRTSRAEAASCQGHTKTSSRQSLCSPIITSMEQPTVHHHSADTSRDVPLAKDERQEICQDVRFFLHCSRFCSTRTESPRLIGPTDCH